MTTKAITNILLCTTFGTAFAFANTVSANETATDSPKFSIDLGYATLTPNDDHGELSGPGLPPQNTVDVKSASSIAMSVNYYQTDNISYQFYVAPAIEFDIDAAGSLQGLGQLSTVDVLLPTAIVNYTFNTFEQFKPYIGLGLNYTIFSAEKASPVLNGALGGPTDVQLDNSIGIALQAGFKFNVNKQWYINANYLFIDVDSSVAVNTEAVGTNRTIDLKIDPSVFYVSLGYRF